MVYVLKMKLKSLILIQKQIIFDAQAYLDIKKGYPEGDNVHRLSV